MLVSRIGESVHQSALYFGRCQIVRDLNGNAFAHRLILVVEREKPTLLKTRAAVLQK
jgi:hypothetical protein